MGSPWERSPGCIHGIDGIDRSSKLDHLCWVVLFWNFFSPYRVDIDKYLEGFINSHGLKAISTKQKEGMERLRTVIGPPAMTLDLKAVTERLVNTVDHDAVYLWANEALNYLMHSVLRQYGQNDERLEAYVTECEDLLRVFPETEEDEEMENDDQDEDEDGLEG